MIETASLLERPDLIAVAAGWGFAQWPGLYDSLAQAEARAAACNAILGPDQCFVLLEDGVPVAMAALVVSDLEERPELTPWLAGVYVHPPFRGRGHAVRVVRRVEEAARQAGCPTLWLYTRTAAGLYRGLGWQDTETLLRPKGEYALMRRDLR